VGKGLGTKSEAAKAAGKKLVITEAVHVKDNVQASTATWRQAARGRSAGAVAGHSNVLATHAL
jgi:hypothetical protein